MRACRGGSGTGSGPPRGSRSPVAPGWAGSAATWHHRPCSRGLGRPDMRVLIVTHYFPPETGAPQARLSGLAETWAADGDQVTVLTGMPNHPTGVLPPAYRRA